MLKLPSVHLSYKLLPVAIAASRIVSLVLNFLLPPSPGLRRGKKKPASLEAGFYFDFSIR
jgi:hypothetical protein